MIGLRAITDVFRATPRGRAHAHAYAARKLGIGTPAEVYRATRDGAPLAFVVVLDAAERQRVLDALTHAGAALELDPAP